MKILDSMLYDQTVPGLKKAMDLTWKRNEAIASNIANAETPQYRAVDLSFAGELDRAFGAQTGQMKVTNPKHLELESDSQSHLIPNYAGATKPDGNNVDIDIEMGRLTYNSGKYSAAATFLRKKLSFLMTAIRQI